MPTEIVKGSGGTNCNGVSYGASSTFTISSGSQGKIYYTVASINNGQPIVITGITTVHDAAGSADSFNFYFVSSEKIKKRITTSGGYHCQYAAGGATVQYFNSLLVDGCWPANKKVTQYCPDAAGTSDGSCKITPNVQELRIYWMTPEDYYAQTTKMRVSYYDNGAWHSIL